MFTPMGQNFVKLFFRSVDQKLNVSCEHLVGAAGCADSVRHEKDIKSPADLVQPWSNKSPSWSLPWKRSPDRRSKGEHVARPHSRLKGFQSELSQLAVCVNALIFFRISS